MEEKLNNAIRKLENIVYYHNKNLTKKQYFDLQEVLETIQEIKTTKYKEEKIVKTVFEKYKEQLKYDITRKLKQSNVFTTYLQYDIGKVAFDLHYELTTEKEKEFVNKVYDMLESEEKKMKFEMVVIYRDNDRLEEMKDVIEQKIKSHNFEIGEIDEWGKRLLAYPIKKENRGYYILYNLYNKGENAQEKADSLAKEIETLQYEEDKILKFVLVRL